MPKSLNNVILSTGVNEPNKLFTVVEDRPQVRQRPRVSNLPFQRITMKNQILRSIQIIEEKGTELFDLLHDSL